MNVLRKFLILFHRYLGIPLSFVFVLWFVSGIAMIYAGGMPQLTPQTRIERLPPLALDRVALTPLEAAEAAGAGAHPEDAVLLSVMDRPAYRFGVGFGTTTVFADSGEPLEEIDVDTSRGRRQPLPAAARKRDSLRAHVGRARPMDAAAADARCRCTNSRSTTSPPPKSTCRRRSPR